MTPKPRFIPAAAFLATLSPAERRAAKAKAATIIAEETTLRDLRKARDLTQAEIGAALKIGQDQVSRIEQRTDMLLSTLRNYVASLGGDMHVLIEFPDRPPVKLANLSDIFETGTTSGRKKNRIKKRA
jgi:hypothetical protein